MVDTLKRFLKSFFCVFCEQRGPREGVRWSPMRQEQKISCAGSSFILFHKFVCLAMRTKFHLLVQLRFFSWLILILSSFDLLISIISVSKFFFTLSSFSHKLLQCFNISHDYG